MDRLLTNSSDWYSTVMFLVLAICLLWEIVLPLRACTNSQRPRWTINFLLMAINSGILMQIISISTVAVAINTQTAEWGLFNQVKMSWSLVFVLSVLIFDLSKYAQHYFFHRLNFLWRIHRVHHADPECDATTSLRFHPLESIFAVLLDCCIIIIFGIPATIVVLYRLVRVAISTIVHSNISFPVKLDQLCRYVLVTPDVHRIHHSIKASEHNANFSGGLIWWDILFRTYLDKPNADQRNMRIGLSNYTDQRANSLLAMLIDPFHKA